MNNNTLSISNKMLTPIIERNKMIRSMTRDEKLEYIKMKYNLNHGKGKRKKSKKK